jgi:hypothetical protein
MHCRALRALRRRDPAMARHWIVEHLRHGKEGTLSHYDDWEGREELSSGRGSFESQFLAGREEFL